MLLFDDKADIFRYVREEIEERFPDATVSVDDDGRHIENFYKRVSVFWADNDEFPQEMDEGTLELWVNEAVEAWQPGAR